MKRNVRLALPPPARRDWMFYGAISFNQPLNNRACVPRTVNGTGQKGEHDGELNNPDKVAGLVGMLKNRQKPIGKGERFDKIVDASEHDDEANIALVNALLGRTPSPTKRKAEEPDTQYLDSPGFLPPQEKRRKPSPKDAVVDLTAED